jgi:hypothetical protein
MTYWYTFNPNIGNAVFEKPPGSLLAKIIFDPALAKNTEVTVTYTANSQNPLDPPVTTTTKATSK